MVQTSLQANKLTLNVKKTKFLIIASNHRLNQLEHDFDIKVKHQSLLRLNSYRYLGIDVDKTLSWQTQVGRKFKISAGLEPLKWVRNLVPRQTLLRIYEALILPYLDYCGEVWECLGKCLSDGLQKLQNRAGRIITYSCYEHRSSDILNDLGWETLDQRRTKQLAVCVYKTINNLFPTGLKSWFEPTSQIHLCNLRDSSNNIFIQRPQTDAPKKSFSYRVAVLWNSLPNEV